MVSVILLVLLLFFAQTLLPGVLRIRNQPSPVATTVEMLGPRDTLPPTTVYGERAQRALLNLHEAMPVFLALALLHVATAGSSPRATLGATIFLIARVLYVPAYLSGIAGVRSLFWAIGVAGMLLMALPLIGFGG